MKSTKRYIEYEKEIYNRNIIVHQLLVMSFSSRGFGLFNKAKTKDCCDDLSDCSVFDAWMNQSNRYVPNSASDSKQLSGEFNKCSLNGTSAFPELCFIKLNPLNCRMMFIIIQSTLEKQDMNMIADILNNLPSEYSRFVISVDGITAPTCSDLKSKIKVFWRHKFHE
jgi:hypothetical protein